jgi:hypothetical protein
MIFTKQVTVAFMVLGASQASTDQHPRLRTSRQLAPSSKVKICHVPPDDPLNFRTITVGQTAIQGHLDHGDHLGSCNQFCDELCDDGNVYSRSQR